MFVIKKIQLNELLDFTKSDKFSRLENKPISSLRVKSYLKNPNAKLNDIVLYMAFKEEKLVGYRTIWSDVFWLLGKPQNFGWLSGSWVHPNYRRKGISTKLFKEVFKDWHGRLMFTNYAVNSKLLYDKTGQFLKIKSLISHKFYTRFCLADILVHKHTYLFYLKPFLIAFDSIFNFIFDIRFLLKSNKNVKSTVKKNESWNAQIESFLKVFNQKEFLKLDKNRLQWVKNYPWMLKKEAVKKEAKSYFFSLYAKDFKSNYFTFYDSENKIIAFVWINIKDGHLKIPYVYYNKIALSEVSLFIVKLIKKEKIKTVLIYDRNVEKLLNKNMFYITKKAFYQNYYATKNIALINKNIHKKEIQSGNGDVIFT